MSKVSNLLRQARGTLSSAEAAKKSNLSRESIGRTERGEPIKFSTLRQIKEGLELSENQWLDIVVAWITDQVGDDSKKLFIEPKRPGKSDSLLGREENQIANALSLFEHLNPGERTQILKAMQRPEVRACLPAINRLWETLDANSTSPEDAKAEGEVLEIVERETRAQSAAKKR